MRVSNFYWATPSRSFVPVTSGPQLFVSGYYTYGESRLADLMNHQYEYADTLSLSRGRHQLKFGFDVINSSSGGFGQEFGSGYLDGRFQINPQYETIPIATLLTYNPGAAAAGRAAALDAHCGQLHAVVRQPKLQRPRHAVRTVCAGQLEHSPNLTLNLGLRWDGETFTGQNALFSPRVGLAWRLPNSNTVIRAGYGIYYSEERTDLYASAALGGPQVLLPILQLRAVWASPRPSLRSTDFPPVPSCPRET